MLRFIARHGLVRMIGGRAVPALLLWDLAVMANRARQIPAVERGLRRGVDAAGRRAASAMPIVRARTGRRRGPASPPRPAGAPDPAGTARPGRPRRSGDDAAA
jgi:hypothetical protein